MTRSHFPESRKEEIVEAVSKSYSMAETMRNLGIMWGGGSQMTLKKRLDTWGVDYSHFMGQGRNKGVAFGPKRPIQDYLSNKVFIGSHALKLRLIREGYFEAKCYRCNRIEWNGQPIPIELEHINGNHLDNTLSNLTILCPNCHAQTDTYAGKNIGKYATMV